MDGKSCFFIGSRYSSSDIKAPLAEAVERHIIEYGVSIFTVGRYGAFDSMAREVLREAKKQYHDIEIYLLTPYALTQKTDNPEGFDGTFYPEGLEKVPLRLAIVQANRIMVQNSDYLIANPGIGNSRNLVEFAEKREKKGLIKVTLLKVGSGWAK